jgi:hypothetical protein
MTTCVLQDDEVVRTVIGGRHTWVLTYQVGVPELLQSTLVQRPPRHTLLVARLLERGVDSPAVQVVHATIEALADRGSV